MTWFEWFTTKLVPLMQQRGAGVQAQMKLEDVDEVITLLQVERERLRLLAATASPARES